MRRCLRTSTYFSHLLFFIFLFTTPRANAATGYTVHPTTLSFGSTTIGLTKELTISVTATTARVTVSALAFDSPGFQFVAGAFPHMIPIGVVYTYSFLFVPTAAEAYSGSAVFTINGSPVTIKLTGTGVATGAVAKLSTDSLSFSQALGTTGKSQTVVVQNTGTSTFEITSAVTQAPFAVSPAFKKVHVSPGASADISVSYFGDLVGSNTGTLVLSYDVLPVNGVSLFGTTTQAAGFTISTYPTLPLGTVGYAYLAQLLSVNGVGAVSWKLAAGSKLPPGLTLTESGTLSGAITSGTAEKTYTFTAEATDSNANTATADLSLQTMPPTGAACNDISWDVAGTSTPIIPITDLGTGTYFGAEGGLYGGGTNIPPSKHDADGIAIAQGIQPLDSTGNPDPSGQYAIVAIGISTLMKEMNSFVPMAAADPALNSHLVIVNGSQEMAAASDFADLDSQYWGSILNYFVPNAGVTTQQVVAVLFEDIDASPTGKFPSDMTQLQSQLETIAQNVLTVFPNAKLMYYQSRIYSGYSGTFDLQDPEPYAYEYGFAIQGAILDQISGAPSLNYKASNGPVKAPWMSWGAYTWANGMIARSDGLTYSCQDLLPDGRHPSLIGAPKVAAQMMNFFKTADTTTQWFLAEP